MRQIALDAIVSTIYGSAIDPKRWPTLLQNLESLFGGSGCGLIQWNKVSGTMRSISTRPDAAAEYQRNWIGTNPLRVHNSLVNAGQIVSDAMLIPHDELHRTDYFNGFLAAQDIPYILALKLWNTSSSDAVLNIMRGRGRPDWDETDIAIALRLMPHLQLAVELAAKLAQSNLADSTAGMVLDQLQAAVAMLDEQGRALHLNAPAQALVARRDGLTLSSEGLSASLTTDNARLQRLIGQSARGNGHGERRGGAISLARPSGRRPLALLLAPLDPDFNPLTVRRPAVLVTVTDPDAERLPAAANLRALYGLTGSEAALAQGIAGGQDLRHVAEGLNLTVLSARQYLSRIYRKTGTSRQQELVHLLTLLSAAGN